MRTREGNSTDWIQIGEAYCSKPLSIRALAKQFGLSDTAIRKEAKKRLWVKFAPTVDTYEPAANQGREPEQAARRAPRAPVVSAATVKDLTARGRNIILDLMDELEFLNRNHKTLADMVADYVNGEKDAGARAKLLKALDHETRCKNCAQLSTSLVKLNDTAPGKKEQAEDDAKTAAAGTEWGDLEDVPAASGVN